MRLLKLAKRNTDRAFHTFCKIVFRFEKDVPSDTVLIVRTDGIGDMVFFARYLEAIHETYRGSKLVLCCRTETAELARAIPLFDEVMEFRSVPCRRNYFYRWRVLRQVRSVRPSVAIYASYHREHVGDEITLLSGARVTIAFSGNDECIHPSLRLHNDKFFTCLLRVKDHCPEKEKYDTLAEVIGDGSFHGSFGGSGRDSYLDAIAQRSDVLPHDLIGCRFVMLGPGGSGPIRRWHRRKFSDLANRISKEFNLAIVLCGNRDERAILAEIAGGIHDKALVYSDFTIVQVVEVLSRAVAFVGNESGLLHLAASLGIPAVGILGGGHFSRYFPYGSVRVVNHPLDCYECNWRCKFPNPYCITEISVDDVLREVRALPLSPSK